MTAPFDITDGAGCRARLTGYGARLMELWVPDASGTLADIVLGFDTVQDYETGPNIYFGATCGRYANRIAGGRFSLNGQPYQLDQNEGANHLHGGVRGFDKAVWACVSTDDHSTEFALTSPDGDMGYPGKVDLRTRYAFVAPGVLDITMTAQVSGQPTILNLVNHAYFNMAGQGAGPVDAQVIQIAADHYTPVGPDLLPVGPPEPVAGTQFDFRRPRAIDAITPAGGFDHNFCLNPGPGPAVTARDPVSGRSLRLWTNQPGLQFYTGSYIPSGLTGKAGAKLGPRSGFTLETQIWPDSPNQPGFPSAVVAPGQDYHHSMRFDFSLGF